MPRVLLAPPRYIIDPKQDYNIRDDDDNPLTVGQVIRDEYWKYFNRTSGDYGLVEVSLSNKLAREKAKRGESRRTPPAD